MSVATLLFVGAAVLASPQADAAKKYTLDLSKTTKAVKAGDKGYFHLRIKPAKGFKISAEAPLKIKLAASNGLKLHKTKLGHADAKDRKSTSPEFGVRFRASQENGDKAIDVDATFFVCNERICERKREKVKVAIDVTE